MSEAKPQAAGGVRAPWSLRVRWLALGGFVALMVAAVAVGCLLDRPVFHLGRVRGDRSDLDRLFRVMGFVPTWLLAAGAWAMVRWRRVGELGWLKAMNAPILLVVSAGLSGAVAEGVKLMTRRLRPRETGGVYEWRSLWEDPFNSGDLGCPSSHAMVAFGAAWMLCRLCPAATPIWLLLGAGCAATRVVTHAHFVSDVTVSAFLSFAVAGVLWNWHRYNESREAVRTEAVDQPD